MDDWISAIFALVIAILGFAFLAVTFSPRNIKSVVNTRKLSRASIALLVVTVLVAIGWGIYHHFYVKHHQLCYQYQCP